MEIYVLVILLILAAICLIDARSAIEAFDCRVTEACRAKYEPQENVNPNSVIYVFARGQAPGMQNMGAPIVYYIPCNDVGIANKLAKAVNLFGTTDECVISLPSVEYLKQYVAGLYELSDFDLMKFPIPPHKLLYDVD